MTDLPAFSSIPCPVCETSLIIPQPFGNLLLEERLGSGRVATVYRAIDLTLDREIAVKVLKSEYGRDEALQKLFIDEARSASAINHPNIIPIYSCGEMEQQWYIVMQYMEGGSLEQARKRSAERPSVNEVCRWFLEVARGLESAYIHGVLHHEVSPANIFLDVDANVKIADFGLARLIYTGLRSGEHVPPSKGIFDLRRARYVSPEKLSTGQEDVQGDLFSYGAAFYHLLTDQPPYVGDDVGAVLQARFDTVPTPPHELRSEVPETISQVIMKCLSREPADRPDSYAEVARAIHDRINEPAVAVATPRGGSGRRLAGRGTRPSRQGHAGARGRQAAGSVRARAKSITVRPRGNRPSSPVYAAPPSSSAWVPRAILILIIVFLIVLMIVHVVNPPWYEQYIRPLFTPTPVAAPA